MQQELNDCAAVVLVERQLRKEVRPPHVAMAQSVQRRFALSAGTAAGLVSGLDGRVIFGRGLMPSSAWRSRRARRWRQQGRSQAQLALTAHATVLHIA